MNLTNINEKQFAAIVSLLEQKQLLQNKINEIDSTLLAFSSKLSVATKPAKAGKAVKAEKAPVVKAAKAPKASKGKKSRASRGDLRDSIIGLLKKAGSSGLHVKVIANKLGTKTNNVYSWFYTTGKKLGIVKTLGKGKFAIK